jgi:hypothetical protein
MAVAQIIAKGTDKNIGNFSWIKNRYVKYGAKVIIIAFAKLKNLLD